MDILEKAQNWAAKGHLHQRRKFSNLPYIVHPEAVAEIISQVTDNEEVIAAAWMHDIIEDTPTTFEDIVQGFNFRVAELVNGVSKISKKGDGNRISRVIDDVYHYGAAPKWAKAIKIADAIHNVPLMIRDDPIFAPRYVAEKKLLIHHIHDGHPLLASILYHIIEEYEMNNLTVFDLYSKILETKKSRPRTSI